MKSIKRKTFIVITLLTIVIIISGVLLFVLNSTNVVYAAGASTVSVENAVSKEVAATYSFVPLNDTECNVKIANKTEATKANIPVTATIDGKKYIVTEVAVNGFMGASKLTYVGLPNTIKAIRNNAFANCAELSEVNLSNVQEIGNYAFMRCPKLSQLIIPQSVVTINNAILRNNDTQVLCEADQVAEGWSPSWNVNNVNQNPLYGCDIDTALIFDPLFTTVNSENPVAYSISGSKYVTSSGVSRLSLNGEEDYKISGDTIVIPANYNDGTPIIKIDMDSFSSLAEEKDKLIIEYSTNELTIDSFAFTGLNVNKFFINRSISFDGEFGTSENIFANVPVSKIIMPNTIQGIPVATFFECTNLSHIAFVAPQEMTLDNAKSYLNNYNFSDEITLPTNANFYIGENAFYNTTAIAQINIPDTVTTVSKAAFEGWNENQIIKVDSVKNEEGPNWNDEWDSNCGADIQYTGYKIIFNANNGSVSETFKNVYVGKTVGELIEPTLNNANFAGWYTKKDGAFDQKYTKDTVFNGNDNVELFARWQCVVEYKIEAWSTRHFTYELNDTISLYEPYKAGYNGWYRNDSTGIKYNFSDKYILTGNTSFTAEWEEKNLDKCYGYSSTPYSGYWYSIYGPNQLRELRDKVNNNKFDPKLVKLMNNINLTDQDWIPFNEICFDIEGQGYTITYKNEHVKGNTDFGFTLRLSGGMINNVNFRAKIKTINASPTSEKSYIGVVAANSQGHSISNCKLLSFVGNDSSYYNSAINNNVDLLITNPNTITGGFIGLGYGNGIQNSNNNGLSIASCGSVGGIVGENHSTINYCVNIGKIYYDLNETSGAEKRCVGGIAAYHEDNFKIYSCENKAMITFVKVSNGTSNNSPLIGQIVGIEESNYGTSSLESNICNGTVNCSSISSAYTSNVTNGERGYYLNNKAPEGGEGGSCVASGTLITLADGTQVPVEYLRGNEMLLVWNLYTGTFDVAPILFVDSETLDLYKVINLNFSDGTTVKVITEHAFWDFDLNQYVFLREDAEKYIGHWFNKQITNEDSGLSWTKVQLISVNITEETTTAWSPVTYSHLCYYVNGMLSMPGATEGFINIFEVDNDTMKYNEFSMSSDINQYGLFTYDEFAELYPITEEVFNAFNGQYLKVSIGKGLITLEKIGELINRYAELLS